MKSMNAYIGREKLTQLNWSMNIWSCARALRLTSNIDSRLYKIEINYQFVLLISLFIVSFFVKIMNYQNKQFSKYLCVTKNYDDDTISYILVFTYILYFMLINKLSILLSTYHVLAFTL